MKETEMLRSSFGFRHCRRALTRGRGPDYILAVKWLAVILLVVLQSSCTTLANRRDLYSPAPSPEIARPVQTTTTTTTRTEEVARPNR